MSVHKAATRTKCNTAVLINVLQKCFPVRTRVPKLGITLYGKYGTGERVSMYGLNRRCTGLILFPPVSWRFKLAKLTQCKVTRIRIIRCEGLPPLAKDWVRD